MFIGPEGRATMTISEGPMPDQLSLHNSLASVTETGENSSERSDTELVEATRDGELTEKLSRRIQRSTETAEGMQG